MGADSLKSFVKMMPIVQIVKGFTSKKDDEEEKGQKSQDEARRRQTILASAKGRGGAVTGTLGNPDIVRAGLTSKTGG